MADITFNYKGNTIGEISASGTHTLDTEGQYCEDDIEVVYVKPSGGGGDDTIPDLKDVVFIDYDGTILHNMTAQEFLALDAMPSNPSHTGLTAQGWNWSLADAQTYVRANGMLLVGQNYKTTDNKTKVYVTVTEVTVGAEIYIGVTTSVKGAVTIDWGDGASTVTTANANTYGSYVHSYSSAGDYVIELSCSSGTYGLGGSGSNYGFIRNTGETMRRAAVTKVEVSNYVTQIHRMAFEYCESLQSITIPTSVQTFGSSTNGNEFNSTALKAIVLPAGSTQGGGYICNKAYFMRFVSMPKSWSGGYLSDGNLSNLLMCTHPGITSNLSDSGSARALYEAHCMQKVCLPGTYTAIASNTLRNCLTVKKVTIPASVTSIAANALFPMPNIREYHFLPTTPPTLASTSNMFTVNANVKIYVPYSADHSVLNVYQTASNWTSFASYIEEEPQ